MGRFLYVYWDGIGFICLFEWSKERMGDWERGQKKLGDMP